MTWWRRKPDHRRFEKPRGKADLEQFWAELLIMLAAWALLGIIVLAIKGGG